MSVSRTESPDDAAIPAVSDNDQSALKNKGDQPRYLSIDELANNKRFKAEVGIQTQHEDETLLLIRVKEKEAISNLWRQNISFGLTVGAVVVMIGLALWLSFFATNPDPEMKKWASGILQSLIALVAGKIGFDIRRATSK